MLNLLIRSDWTPELPSPQAYADALLENVDVEGTHVTSSPGFLLRVLRRVAEATGDREKQLLENSDGSLLQLTAEGYLEPQASILKEIEEDTRAIFDAALDKRSSDTEFRSSPSYIIHDEGPEPE